MNSERNDRAQAYLKAGGGHCLFCGSERIEGGRIKFYDGRAYQRVSCRDCGKAWDDGYTLDSVALLDDDCEDFIYAEADPTKLDLSAPLVREQADGTTTLAGLPIDPIDRPAADERVYAERPVRVLIVVEGGCVQEVMTDSHNPAVQVCVKDLDNIQECGERFDGSFDFPQTVMSAADLDNAVWLDVPDDRRLAQGASNG